MTSPSWDDGSTDATGAVAATHRVWLLRHPVNCGEGAALRTGIAFALSRGADIIVSFDAGRSATTRRKSRCWWRRLKTGGPTWPSDRDFSDGRSTCRGAAGVVLNGARWFTRLFSGVAVGDPHNGFRAFSHARPRSGSGSRRTAWPTHPRSSNSCGRWRCAGVKCR